MMKINEIFYSLQGEGTWTGTPMVFIRFAGCNLNCSFCDTEHQQGIQMEEEEIIQKIKEYPARWVVLTGGEPSLFITKTLIDKIHYLGRKVAIETNGTHQIAGFPDWVTLSPKDMFIAEAKPILKQCSEIKVVFDGEHLPSDYNHIYYQRKFIQPCDSGDIEKNNKILQKAINFCKENPEWHLSLQTHKILNIL